jgi:SHS2 domain-containing protein
MYEIFEHTADVGIRVRAEGLEELFVDAARGLFSIMVANVEGVRAVEEVTFQLRAANIEELLHDWLAELLYSFHARRLVLSDFNVCVTDTLLSARSLGESIDPIRHEIGDEVKAITWHALKVEQTGDGWLAEVIVDV